MIATIFGILSIYSVAFLIKESSILDKPRNWILPRSPFFFNMLDCWFCTGIHAGWIAYFLTQPVSNYTISGTFMWALAGGPVSLIMNALVDKLYRQEDF